MKKNKFLVLLVMLILFPLSVKADVCSEETKYQAKVVNEEGVSISLGDREKVIPYNEEVEVTCEYYEQDELMGIVEYQNNTYFVNLNDFKATDDLKNEWNEQEHDNIIVIKEGTHLYKYPSFSSEFVEGSAEIPVGTKLTSKKGNGVWLNIKYKGKEGWANISYEELIPSIAYYQEKSSILLSEDLPLRKEANIYSEELITVPKEKKITYEYFYITLEGSMILFTEYSGVKGWLSVSPEQMLFDLGKNVTILTLGKIDLYESDIFGTPSNKKVTIPKNTEIKAMYSDYEGLYYVEYEKTKGWIDSEGEIVISTNAYSDKYITKTTKGKLEVYENIEGKKTGKTLKDGEKLEIKYVIYDEADFTYYYIEHIGWVYAYDNEGIIYDKDNYDKDFNIEEQIKEEQKTQNKNSLIKYISIGAAVVIVAVGTVIIIKKKSKKKEK